MTTTPRAPTPPRPGNRGHGRHGDHGGHRGDGATEAPTRPRTTDGGHRGHRRRRRPTAAGGGEAECGSRRATSTDGDLAGFKGTTPFGVLTDDFIARLLRGRPEPRGPQLRRRDLRRRDDHRPGGEQSPATTASPTPARSTASPATARSARRSPTAWRSSRPAPTSTTTASPARSSSPATASRCGQLRRARVGRQQPHRPDAHRVHPGRRARRGRRARGPRRGHPRGRRRADDRLDPARRPGRWPSSDHPSSPASTWPSRRSTTAGGVLGQHVVGIKGDSGDATTDQADQTVDRLLVARTSTPSSAPPRRASRLSVIDKITAPASSSSRRPTRRTELSTYADKGLYFRTAPPDVYQGDVLGQFVVDDGNQTVAIINLNDAYGNGLADQVDRRPSRRPAARSSCARRLRPGRHVVRQRGRRDRRRRPRRDRRDRLRRVVADPADDGREGHRPDVTSPSTAATATSATPSASTSTPATDRTTVDRRDGGPGPQARALRRVGARSRPALSRPVCARPACRGRARSPWGR